MGTKLARSAYASSAGLTNAEREVASSATGGILRELLIPNQRLCLIATPGPAQRVVLIAQRSVVRREESGKMVARESFVP